MALVCLAALCTGAYAQEAAIAFDAELVEVAKGGSAKIGYTVEGDEDWGKSSKKVWSSSDKSVAAVSDGKFAGYQAAADACVSMEKRYEPRPIAVYEKKYRQFCALYDAALAVARM